MVLLHREGGGCRCPGLSLGFMLVPFQGTWSAAWLPCPTSWGAGGTCLPRRPQCRLVCWGRGWQWARGVPSVLIRWKPELQRVCSSRGGTAGQGEGEGGGRQQSCAAGSPCHRQWVRCSGRAAVLGGAVSPGQWLWGLRWSPSHPLQRRRDQALSVAALGAGDLFPNSLVLLPRLSPGTSCSSQPLHSPHLHRVCWIKPNS